jgi:hypothetical protein
VVVVPGGEIEGRRGRKGCEGRASGKLDGEGGEAGGVASGGGEGGRAAGGVVPVGHGVGRAGGGNRTPEGVVGVGDGVAEGVGAGRFAIEGVEGSRSSDVQIVVVIINAVVGLVVGLVESRPAEMGIDARFRVARFRVCNAPERIEIVVNGFAQRLAAN